MHGRGISYHDPYIRVWPTKKQVFITFDSNVERHNYLCKHGYTVSNKFRKRCYEIRTNPITKKQWRLGWYENHGIIIFR